MRVCVRRSWAAVPLVGLAGSLLAVVGAVPAGASGPACGGGAPKLTVHGTGVATGTPNLLTLTLAVEVGGPTAQTALAADNSSTSAVVSALAAGGVKGKDVQTTGLSIQPTYNTKGTLTGYTVTNSVVADIHDFSTAGAVIDSAASAAGNGVRINSLSFSIQDPRGLQDQARQDAVHQAVSHASTMAAAAGERLAGVCSLTDNSAVGTVRGPVGYLGASNAQAAAVPVEPGSQQASAQVTLVYALHSAPTHRR